MACWPAKGTKPTALAAQGFLLRIQAGTLFEKVFTKSDAKAGRIVIPKRYAEAFFPRLDSQAGVTLSLVDVWGDQHHAQYTYWSCNHRDESGQKRMFVMAASTLLAAYGLEAGDVIVFARMPDGTLVACGREADGEEKVRAPRSSAAGRGLSSSTQHQHQQQQQGQSVHSIMAGAVATQQHQVSRKRPAESRAEWQVSSSGPPMHSMLPPHWMCGMPLPPEQADSLPQQQVHSMLPPEQPATTSPELKRMRLQQEAPLSVLPPAQQPREEKGARQQQLQEGEKEQLQQQQRDEGVQQEQPVLIELPPLRPQCRAHDLPAEESSRLYSWTEELPQLMDGVFRAAPPNSSLPVNQVSCITIVPGSSCLCYAAVVTLGGEKYQAFYDNSKAAEFDLEAVLQSQPPTGAEAVGLAAAWGNKPFTHAQAALSKLRTHPQQQAQQGAAAGGSSGAARNSGRSSAAAGAGPRWGTYAAAESDCSPVAVTPPRAAAVRAAAHAAAALTLIATSPPLPALRLRARPSRRKQQLRMKRPSSAAAKAGSSLTATGGTSSSPVPQPAPSPDAPATCCSKAAAPAATSLPQEDEEDTVSSPHSNELEALNEAYLSAAAAAAAGATAPPAAGAAAAAAAAGSATLDGCPQLSPAPAPAPPTDAAPYRLTPPVLPTPLLSATRPSSAAELGGTAELGSQPYFVPPAPSQARGRWMMWNKARKPQPRPQPPPAACFASQQLSQPSLPCISPAAGLAMPLPSPGTAAAAGALATGPAAAAAAIGLPMTPASLHLLLSFMSKMGVNAAQAHTIMAAAARQEQRWQQELFGGHALSPSGLLP